MRGLPASDTGLDGDVQDVQRDEDGEHGAEAAAQNLPTTVLGPARQGHVVPNSPQAQQQGQIGEGEAEEDGRVVLRADHTDQGGAEDGADAEVGVEDVQHRGRTVAEAHGEQLVEAVVDATETEPREQGRREGGGPAGRQREARRADGHQ